MEPQKEKSLERSDLLVLMIKLTRRGGGGPYKRIATKEGLHSMEQILSFTRLALLKLCSLKDGLRVTESLSYAHWVGQNHS